MLKIKDNVDLKELDKYGFKPKYDIDNGKLKKYEQKGLKYCYVYLSDRELHHYLPPGDSRAFKFNELAISSTLFDLIQAGLVEKVGE